MTRPETTPTPAADKEHATKVLAYGAADCAVILNRRPLYADLRDEAIL